jgi:hypothetical protein
VGVIRCNQFNHHLRRPAHTRRITLARADDESRFHRSTFRPRPKLFPLGPRAIVVCSTAPFLARCLTTKDRFSSPPYIHLSLVTCHHRPSPAHFPSTQHPHTRTHTHMPTTNLNVRASFFLAHVLSSPHTRLSFSLSSFRPLHTFHAAPVLRHNPPPLNHLPDSPTSILACLLPFDIPAPPVSRGLYNILPYHRMLIRFIISNHNPNVDHYNRPSLAS